MKYLAYTLAALALVTLLGLTAALLLVDPNQFKDEIAGAVEQHTGRRVKITGDLTLTLFPWIGLRTGSLELGNAIGFGPEPFLKLDGAEIQVKLLPLLSRRLEVKRVILERPVLNLIKDINGRTNWQDLAGQTATETPPEPGQGAEPKLATLAVGGIVVKEGVITWQDRQSGQTLRFEHVNAHVGKLHPDKATAVSLGFVLLLPTIQLKETLALEGQLIVDEQWHRFQLDHMRLQSHTEGDGFPGKHLEALLNVKKITADLVTQTVTIEDLQLEAAKAVLKGDLSGQTILETPRFIGTFRLQASPRDVLAEFAKLPETPDPEALAQLQLNFKLTADANAVTLGDLQGILDDSHWQGAITVILSERPQIRFQLDIDAIDADRYLVQTPPETSALSSRSEQSQRPLLPLEALAPYHLDGRIRLDELKIHNFRLKDVTLTANSKDKQLILKPQVGLLYQGYYQGRIDITTHGSPAIMLSSIMEKVALNPLLRDYLNKPSPLSGRAFLDCKLQAQGRTLPALKRSLNGEIALKVKDGSLNDLELLKLIRQGELWWKGQTSFAGEIDQLRFMSLDFSAHITNGVVRTDRLLIDGQKLKVEGTGSIDLANDRLDYTLRAVRLRQATTENGQNAVVPEGMPVIIRVSGPLDRPKYVLGITQMAKERYRRKIEKAKSKLKKKLGPGGDRLLKGLLRQ